MKTSRGSHWLAVGLSLTLIWSALAFVMHATDEQVSWPRKVLDIMEATPWLKGKPPSADARRAHIEKVVRYQNLLDMQQSAHFREDGAETIKAFFSSLTSEEKDLYAARTVERHFGQLDRQLKFLTSEDRKRLVGRFVKEMRPLSDQDFTPAEVEADPVAFMRTLPPEIKIEIAPAIESMLSRLQGPGFMR